MKIKTTNKILAATLGFALVAASTQMTSAALISLTNAGFETDDIPANTVTGAVPSGWTSTANPNALFFVSDGTALSGGGINSGHSSDQYFLAHNTSGATKIHQDTGLLWSSLTAGYTLTISAWTTYRSDVSVGTIQFSLNDSDSSGLFSLGMDATDAGATAAGVWTERSWTYTVTSEDLSLAAANSWGAVNVQIGMLNNNGEPLSQQVAFDDVSLVYIPEPSGLALCGFGLGLLTLRRKR